MDEFDPNIFGHDYLGIEPADIQRSVNNRLVYTKGKDPYTATERDWMQALCYVVRDRLIEGMRHGDAQLADLPRQRRLHDACRAGAAHHAAGLRDGHEITQVTQFDLAHAGGDSGFRFRLVRMICLASMANTLRWYWKSMARVPYDGCRCR